MFTASDVVYPILDPTFAAEAARLWSQHIALRTCLDTLPSLLPETLSLRLLDLACGAGNWLLDVAFELPEAEVVGIDPSLANIQYAHARARVSLCHNISVSVMDLRSGLHFPHDSFDLICGHFLSAWLTEEQWLPMLTQCRSFLRPHGVLRLIEAEAGHCSSPACEQLSSWYEQALHANGTRKRQPNWSELLRQAGYEVTFTRKMLDFAVVPDAMRKVILMFFALVQSFIVKSGVVTQEVFEQTYQLMHCQIEDEAFAGSWRLLDLQAALCQQ